MLAKALLWIKKGRLTGPSELLPTESVRLRVLGLQQSRLLESLEVAQPDRNADLHPRTLVLLAAADGRLLLETLRCPFGKYQESFDSADCVRSSVYQPGYERLHVF